MKTVAEIWYSTDRRDWDRALERYWEFVQPANVALERSLEALDVSRIRDMDPKAWYDFLHDEYFRWKYTAKNRYATTTKKFREYLDQGVLDELHDLKERLLALPPGNVREGLATACRIRGLGVAGASGLLSLMYPRDYATVDQFIVKALRGVHGLAEATELQKMNPEGLTQRDGVILINLLARKAAENNRTFARDDWTPRKIDKVLWTYGR